MSTVEGSFTNMRRCLHTRGIAMKLLSDYTTQDGQIVVEIPWLEFLRSQGYRIREIKELHTVHSESREGSHIVVKIETYRYPQNHDLLDVANENHQISVWACSCEDFSYNKSVDVSKPDISPDMAQACKHIQACSKVERAKSDDRQATLK